MFGGSFNLATIWSAKVDGLAMQGAPVVRPTGCKALFVDRSSAWSRLGLGLLVAVNRPRAAMFDVRYRGKADLARVPADVAFDP
jgi:hypothetical protein